MNITFLIIFLVSFLVVVTFSLFTLKQVEKARNKRALSIIRGQAVAENKDKADRDTQNKRREDLARKLKQSNDVERKETLDMKLKQAGSSMSVAQFWIGSVVLMLVAVVLAIVAKLPPVAIILIGVTGLLGLPRYILRWKIRRRQKKFLTDFADALEAMVRLLKAGMPVTEAIHMAGKEFEGPMGEEMMLMYEAQRVGMSLPEAAQQAARRMPITEMQMFATGMTIQQQTGASLSEVLMNLASVIRARFKLKRKIQALSSEAKASAMIIGALPFLVGTGMFFLNPEYAMLLVTTSTGKFWLGASAVWMMIGIFIMKAMINFKI
ncbi:MAG: type II secretion system F family protein [Micavibrio aeruginosavorus]|uniref:Type II secretion system F family protein n=1 Tax=Micavibrio aeruginosavorus TaxID=349221 RepID=A0A7T5R3Q2_9BACT|nr:MAG: type II secretion system F family protein [Micavibrio aeruginosavorus]